MFEGEYDDDNTMSPDEIQATKAEFGNMTDEEQQFYLQLLAGEKIKHSRSMLSYDIFIDNYDGEGEDDYDPSMANQHESKRITISIST